MRPTHAFGLSRGSGVPGRGLSGGRVAAQSGAGASGDAAGHTGKT